MKKKGYRYINLFRFKIKYLKKRIYQFLEIQKKLLVTFFNIDLNYRRVAIGTKAVRMCKNWTVKIQLLCHFI